MHSFQPSRGRILFEVLCAVGIAASSGGAWLQTGASALLAAAFIATLFALVHFFDLFRRAPLPAAEPQRIDFASDGAADLSLAPVAAPEPMSMDVEEVFVLDPRLTEFEKTVDAPVEALASNAEETPRSGSTRKGGRRSASATKKAKALDAKPAKAMDSSEPAPAEAAPHVNVAPLFEPDPYHRMQRSAFGRRGQI